MDKIIVLSEFGFKLASNPDKWVSCDKKFISSSKFKSLKVNDFVDSFISNAKGFVTDVSFPQHRKEVGSNSPNVKSLTDPYTLNNSLPTSLIKNGQIYGQCVNLAFNHVSNNECGLNINEAFDLADKIYIEYMRRI
jgi:hypothetical protein